MAKPVQHDDFGEKIGGAKKDLWQSRGLYSGDLAGMNEREADKYVKKDYIWKKDDYKTMIDGGVPFDVAYFIKTVRDSLDTAPTYLPPFKNRAQKKMINLPSWKNWPLQKRPSQKGVRKNPSH